MRLREAVRIEIRAAAIAASMLHSLSHDMIDEELVGWMSRGDPARAERGSYPKSHAWQAGWLAATIYSERAPRDRAAAPLAQNRVAGSRRRRAAEGTVKKLSDAQRRALRVIVDRYDRAVRDERARWGEESAQRIVANGVDVPGFGYRTLHALADRGLVTIKTHEGRGEELRKGAFGRLVGGTRKYHYTVFFAAPTDLGRAEALL